MSSEEKFCLKWNDFRQNVGSSYKTLREDGHFADVTLACEDGEQIEAHRVILAASSTFFNNALKKINHAHPFVYMKGVKAKYLVSILDFVYNGETDVFQDDIDNFLSVAEDLGLRGLTANIETDKEDVCKTKKESIFKEKSSLPTIRFKEKVFEETENVDYGQGNAYSNEAICDEKYEIEDIGEDHKTVETQMVSINNSYGDAAMINVQNHDELAETIGSIMERVNGVWKCKMCEKTLKDKQDMRRHIEGKHLEGVQYPCDKCEKVLRSRNALRIHIKTIHVII